MTHPHIPPQPGGPGAYEQQLTARCRRLEQDRTTLETELGQARQRNAELQQRAETAEAERDAARTTSRRLNARAQQAESRFARVRRAVGEWQLNDRGTYVPLRSLAAIARAVGREIPDGRFELHYQHVKQLTAERDQLAAGAVLVCSDERHQAKVAALETRLAAVRAIATQAYEGGSPWDGEQQLGGEILEALNGDTTTPASPSGRCTAACSEGHTYEPPCEQAIHPPKRCDIADFTDDELTPEWRKLLDRDAEGPS